MCWHLFLFLRIWTLLVRVQISRVETSDGGPATGCPMGTLNFEGEVQRPKNSLEIIPRGHSCCCLVQWCPAVAVVEVSVEMFYTDSSPGLLHRFPWF